MNKLSYFESTYKFEDVAVIESIQKDDKGYFITLDHTIFYPQGGGQPADQGLLQLSNMSIPIVSVKMVNSEIRHYTDQNYSPIVGQKVQCCLNQEKRLLHAKLHTAGHLISNILESLYPNYRAIKGHHFPNECYVEFINNNGDFENIDVNLLNQQIAKIISESQSITAMFIDRDKLSEICPDLSYHIKANELIRVVRIGSFRYQPCGGTHVDTTSELHGLEVTKFKINKGTIKVSYIIKV